MDFSGIAGLSDINSWATADELRLAAALLEAGQSHIFAGWTLGADVDKKHALFEQVLTLEKNYPGGAVAYTKNAQELLRSSAAGENPFEGMAPEVCVRVL